LSQCDSEAPANRRMPIASVVSGKCKKIKQITISFSGSILTEDKRVLYVTFNGCFASNMDYVIQNDGYVGNELGLIYSPLFAFDIKQIQKYNTK